MSSLFGRQPSANLLLACCHPDWTHRSTSTGEPLDRAGSCLQTAVVMRHPNGDIHGAVQPDLTLGACSWPHRQCCWYDVLRAAWNILLAHDRAFPLEAGSKVSCVLTVAHCPFAHCVQPSWNGQAIPVPMKPLSESFLKILLMPIQASARYAGQRAFCLSVPMHQSGLQGLRTVMQQKPLTLPGGDVCF